MVTKTLTESGRLTDEQTESFKQRLEALIQRGKDLEKVAERLGYKDVDEMRKATAPSAYIARAKFEALEDLMASDEPAKPRQKNRRESDRAIGKLREAHDCLNHAREITIELGMDAMADSIAHVEAELRGALTFAEHTARP